MKVALHVIPSFKVSQATSPLSPFLEGKSANTRSQMQKSEISCIVVFVVRTQAMSPLLSQHFRSAKPKDREITVPFSQRSKATVILGSK